MPSRPPPCPQRANPASGGPPGPASPRPAVTAKVPVMKADSPRAGSSSRDLLPLFPEHSSVSPDGELAIGGVGVRDLAERFGTPAYIVDEAGLRNQAGRFKDGLAARHPDSEVVFASKSLPCLAVYKLFAAAGLSIDVGGADSKFGLPLDQAREAIARIRASEKLQLDGLHLHIGSQILDTEPFAQAVEAVSVLGELPVYDVGGGLGVRYTLKDEAPTVEQYLDTIATAARNYLPAGAKLVIEPGRSLVASSCVTLYRVTTVKHTGRTFVAVDGGMADNLDAALTGQGFEAALATRMTAEPDEITQLVGRQCESGDLLVGGLPLPAPQVGDLIAMPVTGAYTYTMANNYNGALRPPIVFCRDGHAQIVAERETHEHVLALHRPALDIAW